MKPVFSSLLCYVSMSMILFIIGATTEVRGELSSSNFEKRSPSPGGHHGRGRRGHGRHFKGGPGFMKRSVSGDHIEMIKRNFGPPQGFPGRMPMMPMAPPGGAPEKRGLDQIDEAELTMIKRFGGPPHVFPGGHIPMMPMAPPAGAPEKRGLDQIEEDLVMYKRGFGPHGFPGGPMPMHMPMGPQGAGPEKRSLDQD